MLNYIGYNNNNQKKKVIYFCFKLRETVIFILFPNPIHFVLQQQQSTNKKN